ncbi:venom acid phosphatase Acph-1-like [Ceratina calcarata]|uniref:acid phosphatase n=1 Tax=Ceratina calcarata TaxID=156304 RepID=A0AAJ7S9J9_9HYME|nr:venom acid phosphatase Acph-1-like [Ceratina calcarata]XP_017888902.1 venom acid phosphatase Acph-1-like [Ceratina calcarata]XP_026673915.1 venom acid phosphatase Acph-1-like [Ceratina calcarata]XP_026673919.1 venom acid phosphatase Acph-1-like [Ceratina calcarata]XP_026673923.1 venom acid phosphatase Acph-1-like [Ceratina calcarata]XP_026673934.1 venom acid phosphatase Acph-1-like [Ceratina calcarata]XP_026673940.1 venom acid phosphatase Acph-1-like [Ceratina calcarata]
MRVIVIMLSSLCILMKTGECVQELQLLQIIFAHKTYAPIFDLIYNNDTDLPSSLTYEYFNTAPLSMPKTGMLNMYNLGVHLRETYDEFLGDVYKSDTMKMRTAEYPLSMISGQLVNAGLWPPAENQKWSTDMNWQPIPTDYELMQKDALLLGTQCPRFIIEMNKVLRMEQMRERWSGHLNMFDHISRSTGMKIRQPSDVALLYAVLETKADLNQSLPQWAQDIFPDGGMYNISLLEYDLLWQTSLQKQLNGGTILKEVLANSLSYIDKTIPKERKLMIYSGNDRNIVGVLKALNLWSPHIPNEAASIIFELYFDSETGDHGIKVNYYTGVYGTTIPLTIPNCTEICPIKTFLYSVMDVLPRNAEQLCNWQKINLSDTHTIMLDNIIHNGSGSLTKSVITLIILWVIIITVQ